MALTVLRARLGRCAAVAGLLCYASAASADIPAPDKPLPAPPAQRSVPLPLTVEEDATTPVHRIVIPKAVRATPTSPTAEAIIPEERSGRHPRPGASSPPSPFRPRWPAGSSWRDAAGPDGWRRA